MVTLRFIPWHQERLKFSLVDSNCFNWFKKNIYNICPSAFWQLPNASCQSQEIAEGLSTYRNFLKDLRCVISISPDGYILKPFHFIKKNIRIQLTFKDQKSKRHKELELFKCKKTILSELYDCVEHISVSYKRGK